MTKSLFIYLLLSTLLYSTPSFAQPSNDDCANAIVIPASTNWCSSIAAYSTVASTASGYGAPSCWATANEDVWFRFTSVGTDVTITINGNQSPSAGGTLSLPQVALYSGTCSGVINELQCESALGNNNIVSLYKGGLLIGQDYLVRVQSRALTEGTFQFCIQNYNAPANPGSDCSSSQAILCDKSPFVVQSVNSAGSDPDEAANSCLGGLGGNSESNSTWMKWTCDQPGTLTFTLTPTNASDDLDFVVYELPNGVNNCSNKVELRCMAAGDFNYPSPCMGPTGLSLSATDFTETSGCGAGKDNFVRYIDMVAGQSYALLVNNFSNTGNGFEISWGGTGTFLGPKADFNLSTNTICAGQSLNISDASSISSGSITNRSWSLGLGSAPSSSSAVDPGTITYNTPGRASLVLTVTSNKGCVVTKVKEVQVDSCCDSVNKITYNSSSTDVLCRDSPNGQVTISGISANLSYNWSTGAQNNTISNLTVGNYPVTISNPYCTVYDTLSVGGPPEWNIQEQIKRPTCDGGTDGAITINQTSGSNGSPYQYNWANTGWTSSNNYNNLSNGNYTLLVRDKEGCDTSLIFRVNELEIAIDSVNTLLLNPSCFGYSNGKIELKLANGLGPYAIKWSTGASGAILNNLPIGTYSIDTIIDANRCRNAQPFVFQLTEPSPLESNSQSTPTSCYGYGDGTVFSSASGATPPYLYNWSTGNMDSTVQNLDGGLYTVTITDAQNCKKVDTVELVEPPRLFFQTINTQIPNCSYSDDGKISVIGAGGTGNTYQYALNTNPTEFSPSNTFAVPTGNYTVYIQDANGCLAQSSSIFISSPTPISVDAGPDRTIELGDTVNVEAQLSFFDYFSYRWFSSYEDISCLDCRKTSMQPTQDQQTYQIIIQNDKGCTAIDSFRVMVVKPRDVYIPNAFSPDGKNGNETFDVYLKKDALRIKNYQIFDRWGNRVCHKENIQADWKNFGWDGTYQGTPMNSSVYVYMIEVEFIDGYIQQYVGSISLIR